MNGWILIDKEVSFSSNKTDFLVKKIFNTKKAGHLGTLDPFASGLLPIALGEATKSVFYLEKTDKTYEFVIKFGIETDTLDTEGKIIKRSDIIPTEQDIRSCLKSFIGVITQIPPKYCALKINGIPAYKKARKNQDFEIKERQITIHSLDLIEVDNDSAKFTVSCSSGTYVRVLAKDIANHLGTVGYLTELRRIKVGNFDIKNAFLLQQLEKMSYNELERNLISIRSALDDIVAVPVLEKEAFRIKNGQRIHIEDIEFLKNNSDFLNNLENSVIKILYNDILLAICHIDEEKIIHPVRIFNN